MSFIPTSQQSAIRTALLETVANLAIVARAGTGKTSTIVWTVGEYCRAFPLHEVFICAFNKAIAVEVSDKIKALGFPWRQLQAGTIHSMGWGLIRFAFRLDKNAINDSKVRDLIRAQNDDVYREYGALIAQLVHLAKVSGVGFFPDSPIEDSMTWHRIADHYDVNGFDDTTEVEFVVDAAKVIYRASLAQTDVVDFDDMILWPLIKNIRVKFTKDLIYVDEYQDLSRARQALVKKFLRPKTGRMAVVGDDRQAIYGFAGADAAALETGIEQLQATVLPLTQTWRCGRAIVAEAQKYVSDIEAVDGAPDGSVTTADALPADLDVGDAILCRNTAPLISTAYALIRQGKAAKVEGRAIGQGLIALTKRWKVTTIDAFLKRLDDYREREVQKAMAKDQEQKADAVNDKCDTLVEICNGVLSRGRTDLQAVRDHVETLFDDTNENTRAIVLATYHRSKGREWGRVFLWSHSSLCPSPWAKQPWQKRQEENLAYVAITRAKTQLTYVG